MGFAHIARRATAKNSVDQAAGCCVFFLIFFVTPRRFLRVARFWLDARRSFRCALIVGTLDCLERFFRFLVSVLATCCRTLRLAKPCVLLTFRVLPESLIRK